MNRSSAATGPGHPSPPTGRVRRSILDSPWYWLYLFATAGLIGLLLVAPKYAARQAQIESAGLKRQQAALQVRGKQVPVEETSSEETAISLRPLYVLLVLLLVCGGVGLGWHQRRRPSVAPRVVAPRPEP